jgi:hypothetical protein
MAIDPKARHITVSYKGGHVTLTYGLFLFLFPGKKLEWKDPTPPAGGGLGRRTRIYGSRKRSAALGGNIRTLRLQDESDWQVRVAGADLDFISNFVQKAGGKVIMVYSRRGTIYAPQFSEV